MEAEGEPVRAPTLALRLTDPLALHRAHLPFFRTGAVFIETTLEARLGERLQLLLQLPDMPYPMDLSVRVVWISPPGLAEGYPQGLGLGFDTHEGPDLKRRMLHSLAGIDPQSPGAVY
jgi:Tfp pilus assembly protein PilZ